MLRKPIKTIEQDNGKIDIYGNNQARDLLNFHELTESEQYEFSNSDLFSNEEEETYFRYKGHIVPLSDIQVIAPMNPFYGYGFDGYSPDSFFSGLLVKLVEDNERVKVYTYLS